MYKPKSLKKFLKQRGHYKAFVNNYDPKFSGLPLALYLIDFAYHEGALMCGFDWECANEDYWFWAHLEKCWLNNIYNRLGC